ncbi:MAG: tetratricopeptide repeat protein [Candidatus Methylacidiphilales bacterium]|nr:tetratricopeptide repeat protein [Candidatus Methylacidiphilales bacterium]
MTCTKWKLAGWLLFCLTMFGTLAHAAVIEDAFTRANKLYAEQKYTEAIEGYEDILKQNGYSANVLFNLGNACLKDKQFGRAILNYERAIRVDPSDPEIHKNLVIARQEAGLPPIKVPWWLALLRHHSWDEWAYAVSASFTLMWIVGGLAWWRPDLCRLLGVSKEGEIRFWRAGVAFLALSTFILSAFLAVSLQPRLDGVVLKAGPALISPLENAGDLYQLREGEIVNVEGKRNDYFYARNYEGKGGWIPITRMQPIVPDLVQ